MTGIRGRLARILFPAEPRDFPARRGLRNLLRSAHILTGGVLLGGHVFGAPADELQSWLTWTIVSGLLLLATDLHASCGILLEVRGLVVALKLGLLLLIPWFAEAQIALLASALVIGALSSHMPGRYRHHVLLFRRHIAADRRHG